MAKKLDPMDLKQIIRLHLDGLSNREISKALGIGRNAVNGYMRMFNVCGKGMEELLGLDEASLAELFSCKTTINNKRFDDLMRYFEKVNQSKNHPGFTFLYHWQEYKSSVDNPYSYTQFMEHYNRKHPKVKGSMKLDHKVGNAVMIDFAGKHLYITNRQTGEQLPVEVFVATLPFSQYTYVEACMSQKREDLIPCIANSLNFFGGVPQTIVSDNLKSAVSRSSKYEPQINKSLKDFALYYKCAVNPTRAYSPQDKALVENSVNLAYQRIYYPMRNITFFSLLELNKEIMRLLEGYNNLLFQRKESSRRELFQAFERSTLKPLPLVAYQMKDYRRAKVQKMGYVYFSPDKNYYSVPYRFIGRQTLIHYTKTWVEIFYNSERIATHHREPAKGVYITIKDHLSSSHQAYKDWSPEYFKSLAKKHGISVMMFVEGIINQSNYPEIAYKRAMGVIQLHREYGSKRLNNACQRALYGNALKYHTVKNILKNNLDSEQLQLDSLKQTKTHIPKHDNIRGANTYN
jgi:transposase